MIDTLFLDRDGTVIEDGHYLSDPEKIRLIPSAVEGLRLLAREGFRFFIVTNQSGIGRGYYGLADYERCERRLAELLAEQGITIEDTAYCPHAPEEDCACRKPATGMWRALAEKHGLKAGNCAMAGDSERDVLFAVRAGFAAACLIADPADISSGTPSPCSGQSAEHAAAAIPAHAAAHPSDSGTFCCTAGSLAEFARILLTMREDHA
ncbi:MAG: HAD family hydrolase [Mailhella sp.]|nr:HAD family hydrolase [Mailhella sp.]